MSYPRDIKNKVVLVIGGAGGIGAATSQLLAAAGARLIVTHMPGAQFAAVARGVVAGLPGEGHTAFEADVSHTPSLINLRDRISEQHGRLDILVNAAGFTRPIPHADLDALSDDLIDQIFSVNWRGQFAAIRTFAPLLTASGDGLVVSISSIAASTGVGSSIAYCAAKAGIDIMTKCLGRVLAPHVRVLAVAPGVVDTTFVPGRDAHFNDKVSNTTPLKRIAEPDDIAAGILACATHLGFSTGTTIVVDGGRAL
jgi:3-oxoacyl-[acyl-carrier protein] reductase